MSSDDALNQLRLAIITAQLELDRLREETAQAKAVSPKMAVQLARLASLVERRKSMSTHSSSSNVISVPPPRTS